MLRYIDAKQQTLLSVKRFVQGGSAPLYPMMLFLEVSNFCNLTCAMCGPFSRLNPGRLIEIAAEQRGFMPLELTTNLDQMLAHALRTPVFGYGEPTLNPDFPEFLEMCAHYETMTSFFTNGMRLTPQLCEQIVDNRVLEVAVSLSGARKEHYEAVYAGGVWETVLGGIRELARQKRLRGSLYPTISVNSIGFQHHIEHLEEFVEVMADAGANRLLLIPLDAYVPQLVHHACIPRTWVEGETLERAKSLAQARGLEAVFSQFEMTLVSSESEYSAARESLFARFDMPLDTPPTPIEDLASLSVDVKARSTDPSGVTLVGDGDRPFEGSIQAVELGAEDVYCFEPFHTLYVSRNGDVKPCCNAWGPVHMGSVSQLDPTDVWRGDAFSTVRKTILAGGYPRMCHYCVQHEPHPNHNFGFTAGTYRDWLHDGFDIDVPAVWTSALDVIEAAGTNCDIVRRRGSDDRAPSAKDVVGVEYVTPEQFDSWLSLANLRPAHTLLEIACTDYTRSYGVDPVVHLRVEPNGVLTEQLTARGGPEVVVLSGAWGECMEVLPQFSVDTVVITDALEYLEKDEGRRLLDAAVKRARGQVLVVAPLGSPVSGGLQAEGGGFDSAERRIRRSAWLPDDFPGWRVVACEHCVSPDATGLPLEGLHGQFFAVLDKGRGFAPEESTSLAVLDDSVARLEAEGAALGNRVAMLHHEVEAMSGTLVAASYREAALAQLVSEYETSLSWRLTRPLRAVRRLIRPGGSGE